MRTAYRARGGAPRRVTRQRTGFAEWESEVGEGQGLSPEGHLGPNCRAASPKSKGWSPDVSDSQGCPQPRLGREATEPRLPPEKRDRLPASEGTLPSTPPTRPVSGKEAETPIRVEAEWGPSLTVMVQGDLEGQAGGGGGGSLLGGSLPAKWAGPTPTLPW